MARARGGGSGGDLVPRASGRGEDSGAPAPVGFGPPGRTAGRRVSAAVSRGVLSGGWTGGASAARIGGRGAGIHGFRGASGDVRVRGPGFPPDLRPRAPPLAPLVQSLSKAGSLRSSAGLSRGLRRRPRAGRARGGSGNAQPNKLNEAWSRASSPPAGPSDPRPARAGRQGRAGRQRSSGLRARSAPGPTRGTFSEMRGISASRGYNPRGAGTAGPVGRVPAPRPLLSPPSSPRTPSGRRPADTRSVLVSRASEGKGKKKNFKKKEFSRKRGKKKVLLLQGGEEEGADRALPDRIVVLKVWHPAGGDAAARRRWLPMPKGGARQMLARQKALKRKAKGSRRATHKRQQGPGAEAATVTSGMVRGP